MTTQREHRAEAERLLRVASYEDWRVSGQRNYEGGNEDNAHALLAALTHALLATTAGGDE